MNNVSMTLFYCYFTIVLLLYLKKQNTSISDFEEFSPDNS